VEHADTISDPFLNRPVDTPAIGDCPAAYHNGCCTFGFVDGHAELHKWQELKYWSPVTQSTTYPKNNEPGTGLDVQWMVQHSSACFD
jgi:prepilin-type processing-associated H-X9-DG protein